MSQGCFGQTTRMSQGSCVSRASRISLLSGSFSRMILTWRMIWVLAYTASAQCRRGRALRVQAGRPRQPHPHLLTHEFQPTGFTREYSGSGEDFGHWAAQKTPRSQNPPRYDAPRRARASRQPQIPAPRPGMTAAPSSPVPGIRLHDGARRCPPSATLIRAGSLLRWSVAARTWHRPSAVYGAPPRRSPWSTRP
jgi:hypothetical protein